MFTVLVELATLAVHCALVPPVARCEGSVAWDAHESSRSDDGGSEDSEIPESVTRKDCGSRSIDC